MSYPQSLSEPGSCQDTEAIQKRNASQVAIVTIVGASLVGFLYIYLGLQTREQALFALAGGVFAFNVAALVCLALIRRGRLDLGAGLWVGAVLLTLAAESLAVSGLGWLLGAGIMVVMPLLVLQLRLAPRLSNLAVTASLLTGLAVLLLDLYWPFPAERLSIPSLQLTYPLLVGIAAVLSVFLIVRQFAGYPLRTKLTIAFLAVTLIPLVGQGVWNYANARTALLDAANSKLSVAAAQAADNLDAFLGANLDAIGAEAQLPAWLDYLNLPPEQRAGSPAETAAATLLSTLQRKAQLSDSPNIFSYGLLDHSGVNVLDTYKPHIGASEAGRDYFKVAMQLQIGRSYVSPVEFAARADEAYLYFSSPVIGPNGKAIGVLRVSYDAGMLQDQFVVKHTGRVGPRSFAIFLDDNHMVLAHGAASDLVYKTLVPLDAARAEQLRVALRLPARPVNELAAGLPDLEQALINAHTQPYFTTRLTADGELNSAAVTTLMRQPWLVIFAQSQATFLEPVEAQTRSTVVLILGVAGLVAIGALAMAQMFARPLTRLTVMAEKISQGDLSVRSDVETGDEIGLLARTFNTMTGQLQDLIGSLEARVEARTAQLRAGAEVARAASSILNPQDLLQQTVDLICDRFGYYYAAIFLLDEESDPGAPPLVRLRAGRGEPGRLMLERGHKFELGSGMVGWVCANKQARIALDVGQDAVRFANPLLPDTRSEIALPLRVGERVLGALDVQSERAGAFDESDVAVLQGMADQIAVALENARLFDQAQSSLAQNEQLIAQIQTSLKETTALYAAGQAAMAAQDRAGIFRAVIDNVLDPDVAVCLLILFDPYEGELPQNLEINQVWMRTGGQDASLLPGATFGLADFSLRDLLHADQPILLRVREIPPGAPARDVGERLGVSSLAGVPLNVGARWIGTLVLGVSGERVLDEGMLRPYRAVAGQVAAALENRRLFESAQASLHDLDVLYRTYTREAWATTLQARPELAGYEYVRTAPAAGEAVLNVPLTIRGHEIGMVELAGGGRSGWSEQERAFIEAVVTQAALALDSARLFDQTQRLAGRERLINEITARIRASTSVAAIMQTAARELATALDVPHAVARLGLPEKESEGR